ncbi:MAG: tandem-95 repeat protein, partial [Rhodobacteraceae bacterium]|nr:tandem-95 repeat protein [Paracoccaceae bacterium]
YDFTIGFKNQGEQTFYASTFGEPNTWGWDLRISDGAAGFSNAYPLDFSQYFKTGFPPYRSMQVPDLRPGESYEETRRLPVGPHVKGNFVTLSVWGAGDSDPANKVTYIEKEFEDQLTDLVITDLKVPDEPMHVGGSYEIEYTVTNTSDNDLWPGTERLYDQIWLSAGPGNDALAGLGLERVELPGGLAAGESYTRTVEIEIDDQLLPGDYRIHVRANNGPHPKTGEVSSNYVVPVYYEKTNDMKDWGTGRFFRDHAYDIWQNGNIVGAPVQIVSEFPDLVITRFDAPDTITAGEVFEAEIEVTNQGTISTRDARQPVDSDDPEADGVGLWFDRLFLSPEDDITSDSLLVIDAESSREDPLKVGHTSDLEPGESYTVQLRGRVHHSVEGDFTLIAMTDGGDFSGRQPVPGVRDSWLSSGSPFHQVREGPGEGNNTATRAVTVQAADRPELIITDATLPDRIVAGEEVTLNWTVANEGADFPIPQQSFTLELAFAQPGTEGGIEAGLPRKTVRIAPIPGGEDRSGAISFRVPVTVVEGVYTLRLRVDPPLRGEFGDILETPRGEDNTTYTIAVPVDLPPPADLVVRDVLAPGSVQPGQEVTISWKVRNDGDVPVSGPWSDAIYLSRDASLDGDDVLMGRLDYETTLAPGEVATLSQTLRVPPVAEGPWRVLVRTDIFNEVYEAEMTVNNVTAADAITSVSIPQLSLGEMRALSLEAGEARLFRVDPPLAQTMLVRAKGNDGGAPAVFVAQGRVATPSDFDSAQPSAGGSVSRVVQPDTVTGGYYVLVRAGDAPVTTTLSASLLPLAITDVSTDRLGTGRFVTTTISGSQFDKGAVPRLSRPGATAFEPVAWSVIDSTKIVATFNLEGAPLGLYDVSVTNGSGARATVPYRVLVEPASEAEVGVALNGPRVVTTTDIIADFPAMVRNFANIDAPYVYFQTYQADFGVNWMIAQLRAASDDPVVDTALDELEALIDAQGLSEAQGMGLLDPDAPLPDDLDDDGLALVDSLRNLIGVRASDPSILLNGWRNWSSVGLRGDFPGEAQLYRELDPQMPIGRNHLASGYVYDLAPGSSAGTTMVEHVYPRVDYGSLRDEERRILPFNGWVGLSATPLTRAEFVAHQSDIARALREVILDDTHANVGLQALAANEDTWVQLFLAGLEEVGVLRSDGVTPPVREAPLIASLLSSIAASATLGPIGQETTARGGAAAFFDRLVQHYRNAPLMQEAMLLPTEEPLAQTGQPAPDAYRAVADAPTAYMTRDYLMRLPMADEISQSRIDGVGGGFNEDMLRAIGHAGLGGDGRTAFSLREFLIAEGRSDGAAMMTGPRVVDTDGYVPLGRDLPYNVGFANDDPHDAVRELRVVVEIDRDLDAGDFALADMRFGDIEISVPAGSWGFQRDYDFSDSHGFILRVSAGVNVMETPQTATWLVQAIDPASGEVMRDRTQGLLAPGESGEVGYSVRLAGGEFSGNAVRAEARVLMDDRQGIVARAPEVRADVRLPSSTLDVTELGNDRYELRWAASDDVALSHVSLFAAADGGSFRLIAAQMADASGALLFEGEPGVRYEFLSLATDRAGNREQPETGRSLPADAPPPDLGAAVAVDGTTAEAPIVLPDVAIASNPLFARAQAGGATPYSSPNLPPEFGAVGDPFVAEAFATGIAGSGAGIGPLATAEAPDGTILVIGGETRNTLWRLDAEGGAVGDPLLLLDHPVYDLAFDADGRLWAATGGGPLLELDPESGQIIDTHGDQLGLALAPSPDGEALFVAGIDGLFRFDIAEERLELVSRDLDLRLGSIAIGPDNAVWGVGWPDRDRIVRMTGTGRVETVARIDAELDSIAFGAPGSILENLAIVSANNGIQGDGGALYLLEPATGRFTLIASQGTRADAITATEDGRILVSKSGQVDMVVPVIAPEVVAITPDEGAAALAPLPFVQVRFDQPMHLGASDEPGSVLNPEHFTLKGTDGEERTPQFVVWDSDSQTAYLAMQTLTAGGWMLNVSDDLLSAYRVPLAAPVEHRFELVSDLSALIDIDILNTRFDRAAGTVSYDVSVTNVSERELRLPFLLAFGGDEGADGKPIEMDGVSGDGRFLLDLSGTLPDDSRLAPGHSTVARTVTLSTTERRTGDFTLGVVGGHGENAPPVVLSQPPLEARAGETWRYDVESHDADGDQVFHALKTAPDGMTIDPRTGEIEWTPGPEAAAETEVVVHVFDVLGAGSLQRFVIDVENGNRAPVFQAPPSDVTVNEGDHIEVRLQAVDPDGDKVLLMADGLPPGARFDAGSGIFSWTPGPGQAGLYTDLRFTASDGRASSTVAMPVQVIASRPPPVLDAPIERSGREGERIVIRLEAEGAPGAPLRFGAAGNGLPSGATLDAERGVFSWTPFHDQAGEYELAFTVSDGASVTTASTRITVAEGNGAPVFLGLDGWETHTGQSLRVPVMVFDPDNPRYRPPMRDSDGSLFFPDEEFPRSVDVSVISGLPEGATFDPDTWEFIWTPEHDQAGTWEIGFEATDDGAGTGVPITVHETLSLRVQELNTPPEIAPIDPVDIDSGETLEVTIAAHDPEGGPVSLILENDLTGIFLPDFVTFTDHGDGTGTVRIAPGVGDRGLYGLRVIARDSGDSAGENIAEARTTFAVTVSSDNEPPVIGPLDDALALAGGEMALPVTISDMDGDTLEIVLEGLPGDARVEAMQTPDLYRILWTPGASDIGTHAVTLSVTDTGNDGAVDPVTVTRDFTVTVRNSNAAPALAYPGAREVALGETLDLVLEGSDLDGDTLRYGARNLPRGATLDAGSGAFSWTPERWDAGTHRIEFFVTDGLAEAVQEVAVTVDVPNQAPVFAPVPDRFAREGGRLEVPLYVTDPENHLFRLDLLSGPEGAFITERAVGRAGIDGTQPTLMWYPEFGDAGEHRISLRAVDEKGAESVLSFSVRVVEVNRPPSGELPSLRGVVGTTLEHEVNASDPDGDTLAFALEDAPDGMEIDADSGLLRWTPAPGQHGDHSFAVVVNDGTAALRLPGFIEVTRTPVAPSIRIELTPSFPALPGQPVAIRPVIEGAEFVSMTVDGTDSQITETGAASFVPDAPGQYLIEVEAVTETGETITSGQILRVRDPADRDAPVIDMARLPDGGLVSAPTEVIGQIEDANLDYWQVTLEPRSGRGAAVVLAAGTEPVAGTLAEIDPADMADGFYRLRVEARDIGGRRSMLEADVEISSADKPGRILHEVQDMAVDLDGFAVELVRVYDSLMPGTGQRGALGDGWRFAGLDLDLQSEMDGIVSSEFGLYPPLRTGTGVNLLLPDGGRATFSFVPEVEDVDGVSYIRPRWISDDAPGWSLETPSALLRESNGRFFEAAGGAPYNPAAHAGQTNYRLTAPDGRAWGIDSTRGVTDMSDGAGNSVFVTSSGLVGMDGARLDFHRDANGLVQSITAPDGHAVQYLRDGEGRLVLARGDARDGERYGYDARGVLSHRVTPGGEGVAYGLDAGGMLEERAIAADLGGLRDLAGGHLSGTLGDGTTRLAAAVLPGELSSTGAGGVYLRVALQGADVAGITWRGADPVSETITGDSRTAIFELREPGEGLFEITGSGDFEADFAIVGDLTEDGNVGAEDAALFGSGVDVTGDGTAGIADQALFAANFGFTANRAPVLAAGMGPLVTYEGVARQFDLSAIISDPDGPAEFHHVSDVEGGQAAIRGGMLHFAPQDGWTGAASVTVTASDGYATSDIEVPVEVSDAALLGLDFQQRRFLFEDAGETADLVVLADFEGESGVEIGLDMVDVSFTNPGIASLGDGGVLRAEAGGHSVLTISRDGFEASTAVGVYTEENITDLLTWISNIDAYPDAVTIVEAGGSRQIVTAVGSERNRFVGSAEDGTHYTVADSRIVEVSEDGLIRALSPGETTVTVVHAYGEDTIRVAVTDAQIGETGTLDATGGILRTPAGIELALGPGQIPGPQEFSIAERDVQEALAEARELPPGFDGLTVFDFDHDGAPVAGTMQIGIDTNGSADPGDEIVFFQMIEMPIGPDGEMENIWAVIDTGAVDEDGIARTNSPPFPGFSDRGTVLAARASVPMQRVQVELPEFALATTAVLASTMFLAGPVGMMAAIATIGTANAYIMAPRTLERANLEAYYKVGEIWSDGPRTDLTVELDGTLDRDTFVIGPAPGDYPEYVDSGHIPAATPTAQASPVIDAVSVDFSDPQWPTRLTLSGAMFADESVLDTGADSFGTDDLRKARVRVVYGGEERFIYGDEFLDVAITAREDGDYLFGNEVTFWIPRSVFLPHATFFVERPGFNADIQPGEPWPEDTPYVTSNPMQVVNRGGYGFVPDFVDGEWGLTVIDQRIPGQDGEDQTVHHIPFGESVGIVLDVIPTDDLAMVLVHARNGLYVLDAAMMRWSSAHELVPLSGRLDIPGGGISSVTLGPDGERLFVAARDKIWQVDVTPASEHFLKPQLLTTLQVSDGWYFETMLSMGMSRYIDSIAVNEDGTRLFALMPGEFMGYGVNSPLQEASLVAINVDRDDLERDPEEVAVPYGERIRINANPAPVGSPTHQAFRVEDGAVVLAGEPHRLQATPLADRMVLLARSDYMRGLKQIIIQNSSASEFTIGLENVHAARADVEMERNDGRWPSLRSLMINPADAYRSFSLQNRMDGVRFDLDTQVAGKIALLPDLSYGFIVDANKRFLSDTNVQASIENATQVGAKIGVIRDPLSIYSAGGGSGTGAQYLGATTPIPGAIIRDIALSGDNDKLFVPYSRTGNVLVFDVDELIRRAESGGALNRTTPLDDESRDTGTPVNLRPLDVHATDATQIGLQQIAALRLEDVLEPVVNYGEEQGELTLAFSFDASDRSLGSGGLTAPPLAHLYLSAMPRGLGLFPDDAAAEGPFADAEARAPFLDDLNTGRIFTGEGSLALSRGSSYVVTVDGNLVETGRLDDPERVEVSFDPAFLEMLTAGQSYHWGVRIPSTGARASSTFETAARPTETTYGPVTMITHGAEFWPADFSMLFGDEPFRTPPEYTAMAELIARAAGGGVVLHYDRATGDWVDLRTGRSGADALREGEAVMLLTDWVKESNITDTGFAEAAADATFAALMQLDAETDGALLDAPMHFIGHDRGAVVNSEIIQRLGFHMPGKTDIHKTTIDPYDKEQNSLNIPLRSIVTISKSLNDALTAINFVATVVSGASGNVATATAGAALIIKQRALSRALDRVITVADNLGIKISTIEWGKFNDPEIKRWSNIEFADNYFQTAAKPDNSPLGRGFTLSINGRPLSDFDLNVDLTRYASGFSDDDFTALGPIPLSIGWGDSGSVSLEMGLGGPSNRALGWYAGTIHTGITSFLGTDIWRSHATVGETVSVLGYTNDRFERHDSSGWYAVRPANLGDPNAHRWLRTATDAATGAAPAGVKREGIGTGWYYSWAGGGDNMRPQSGSSTPVTFDNTPVSKSPEGAVPTVFNGDFEHGTRQSIANMLLSKLKIDDFIPRGEDDKPREDFLKRSAGDFGRFPFSYQLPGYSFHGGYGFEFGAREFGINVATDLAGLFVLETNPAAILDTMLGKVFDYFSGKVVDQAIKKAQIDFLTTDYLGDTYPEPVEAEARNWIAAELKNPDSETSKKAAVIKGVLNQIDFLFTEVAVRDQILARLDPDDAARLQVSNRNVISETLAADSSSASANAVKAYAKAGFDVVFGEQYKALTQSDYALLMGGNEALKLALGAMTLPDPLQALLDDVIDAVARFDRIAHNRLWVPETGANFLTFETRAPLVMSPEAGIDVFFVEPGADVREVTDAGSDGVLHHERVDLPLGIFRKTLHSVEVPEHLRGQMVKVVIANSSLDDSIFDYSLDPGSGEGLEGIRDYLISTSTGPIDRAAGISQIYFLDNIALAATADGAGEPLQAVAGPGSDRTVAPFEIQPLLEAAVAAWEETGLLEPVQIAALEMVEVEIAELDGSLLALAQDGVVTLDETAAGHGWFVDPAPHLPVEFLGATVDGHRVALDGPASTGIDLLTVLTHELGHILGLPDVPRAEGAERMMTGDILPGIRRIITDHDKQALAALPTPAPLPTAPQAQSSAPTHEGFLNADFSDGLDGWTTTGDVSTSAGVATIAETTGGFSGLSQAFLVPDGATRISLTLSDIVLGQDPGRAPDALEISLFDAATGTALRSLDALGNTDALVSVQSDGTIYFGSGVSAEGLASGDRIDDLAGPLTLTLSLGALQPGDAVRLGLDLIGFGTADSRVSVSGFGLDATNTPPVANPYAVTTDRDLPVVFDPRVNDFDADGDPLMIEIVTGPDHGQIDLAGDGALSYTPDPGYVGSDELTYRVSDGFATSNIVEVSITVEQVNDPPVIAPLDPVTIDEGETLRVTPSATDPDGPAPITWNLVDGPDDMTVDADSGEITWLAPNGPDIQTIVIAARDGAGAESTAGFIVNVANVAPSITLSGSSDTRVNETYALNFSITDPGQDVVSRIEVDWGDGSPVQVLDGDATRATHVFTSIGKRDVRVTVVDETGSYVSDPFGVNVMPQTSLSALARVTGIEPTETQVTASFSLPIRVDSVGADSVIITDEDGTRIAGQVEVASDGRSLTFVADAAMEPGDYVMRLRGGDNDADDPGPDAILAADGGAALDGDDDGVAGGDAVLDFRIAAGLTRPVANPVEVETTAGEEVIIDVLANDLPGDAGPLSAVVQAPPVRGEIEMNADGTITYRPEPGFVGDDVFGYVASDGTLVSDPASVTVRVVSGGGAPDPDPDPDPDPGPGPDPDPAPGAPETSPGPASGDPGPAGMPIALASDTGTGPAAFRSVFSQPGLPALPDTDRPGTGTEMSDRILRCEARFAAVLDDIQMSLPARVAVGREAVLDLAGREAGALDGLRGWMIDWGDGTTSRGSAGDVPSH